ncbi:MAG TPA: heavy-metal-associated domain-containing protein, partial [Segetibacter sp.]
MKNLLIIIVFLITLQASAQVKQVTLQASGLTCAMCSNAINKALQKLSFTDKVQPNIKESSFTIQFKEGLAVDFDAIRKAVEDAGFSVSKMQVKANFSNVKINNDSHVAFAGKTLHFLGVKQQILAGEQTFQIVDKKFVSNAIYKKYAANTKMECVKTGTMENCCS